jgi:dTDP-4-dehydrorhamnose 3,5-epimerase-like enzyme
MGLDKIELSTYVDDRGYSMFNIFPTSIGQVNVTKLDKGAVKAFHLHKLQRDYVASVDVYAS